MAIDHLKLAQDLIKCPSITPIDEGAQDVLKSALQPAGFECHDVPFEDVKNLFARYGTGGRHLCYCGHTDVVPTGDKAQWTYPPFDAVIKDGQLHGRGASDMKGGVACFSAAAARFIEENPNFDGSISLIITGDEEGEAINGTVRVLEWMMEHGHIPDAALGGEPTNPESLGDEIKIGRRGGLTGTITVHGKQGHVAYHDEADNPLPRFVKLLDSLGDIDLGGETAHFQATNLELTTIDVGNKADNVIPGTATANFNIRFNDLWTIETLKHHINAALDSTGIEYDIDYWSNAECFLTTPGQLTDIAANAVESVTGKRPAMTTNGGTSDARFMQKYCPVIECGGVNKTIHQVDECADLEDLEKLTEIYYQILKHYFA